MDDPAMYDGAFKNGGDVKDIRRNVDHSFRILSIRCLPNRLEARGIAQDQFGFNEHLPLLRCPRQGRIGRKGSSSTRRR